MRGDQMMTRISLQVPTKLAPLGTGRYHPPQRPRARPSTAAAPRWSSIIELPDGHPPLRKAVAWWTRHRSCGGAVCMASIPDTLGAEGRSVGDVDVDAHIDKVKYEYR